MKTQPELVGWCAIKLTGMVLLLSPELHGQVFTTLHSFDGSDGAAPAATLIVSSNLIYGSAVAGGPGSNGVVFSMNTNGTGYRILHAFTGGLDGGQPYAGLLLLSNTLYGSASSERALFNSQPDYGVLYSMGADGTRFTVLHRFSGLVPAPLPYIRANADGALPYGPLILWSNLLYGTAAFGGTAGGGTLFSLRTDGTGFKTLHSFVEDTDSERPKGALTPLGEKLYGVAEGEVGDFGDNGGVFSINTNGSGFTLLHRFSDAGNNFLYGLGLTNNALFGVAWRLGVPDAPISTIFRIDTGGSFTNLRTFTFEASSVTNYDGNVPARGPLAFDGTRFYGANTLGGFAASGTIYSIKPDGSGFTVLYTFTGADDGSDPWATVTLSGKTLYGTTHQGGKSGNGTIFRIDLVPIPLPVITNQPASKTNVAGTTATFSVAATGRPPLSYQWLKSTNVLPQQISSKLVLTNLSDKDAGTYSVVVSNGGGSVVSAPAQLVVLDPPAISTQPFSRTNIVGTTATFSVVATGTAPLSYQWFKGASPIARQASSTLMLTNVSDGDAAAYHVVVTNSVGKATSASATLVVLDPPRITRQPVSLTNLAGTTASFTVSATGTAPLNYQWWKGNVPLPQQKGPTLTLPRVSDLDAGSYSLVITNLAGRVTSAPATLTIIDLALLTGRRVADNAVLSWPTGLTGFMLQSTTNLAFPFWVSNSTAPVVVNGLYVVTNPIPGRQEFFRLSR